MKDSFILQTKYKKHFNRLGEKRGYKLLMAIFEYEETRIMPALDESIEDAFYFIKDDLDKAYANYTATCAKNRKNGASGGRPLKPSDTTKNPKNPVGLKKADSDSECDSDNDLSAVADKGVREEQKPQQQQREYISFFSSNIGVISPTIMQEAESYIDDGMSDQMVTLSLKKSVDSGVKNWKYAKKILDSWIEKHITTPEQAAAEEIEFSGKRSRAPDNANNPRREKGAFVI